MREILGILLGFFWPKINFIFIEKKIKNLIICINTGTLSNMNENTKEIYH